MEIYNHALELSQEQFSNISNIKKDNNYLFKNENINESNDYITS